MDDAVAVCGVERAGNFDRNLQYSLQRKRAFLDARCQGLTFDVLHHEIVGTDVV